MRRRREGDTGERSGKLSRMSRRALGRGSAALAAAAALGSCGSDPPERAAAALPFLPPTDIRAGSSFEFIIVGSGAGGGPLAANLARAGRKVLLIEAGGADAGGLHYQVPAFHALATEDPAMQWNYFVRHWEKPPARDSKYSEEGGGIWYPRAGTLGGCTAHNAMITVYPDDADWNAIASATGDASWSSDRMRSYFERLERCRYRASWRDALRNWSGHGYDGWLTTSQADPRIALRDRKLIDIVRAAAEEVGVGGLAQQVLNGLLDPNDQRAVGATGGREGLFLTPLAVADGQRCGTRDYIIETARAHPAHLTVLTDALVTRVLFSGQRAIGVEYLPRAHSYRADPAASPEGPRWAEIAPHLASVHATREVILSAGAFNSPQLLMLSGVGPRQHLEAHGIPVVADRPGVGGNLQDRYETTVVSAFDSELDLLRGCALRPPRPGDPPDPCFAEWQQHRSGVCATNGVIIGIIRRSQPERPLPDLYIFGLPGAFRGYYPGYSTDATAKDRFCWAILKAHTNNTAGEVRLRSADPRDPPDILFRYFEDGNDRAGEDLDSVVAGVEFARAINRRLRVPAKEIIPGPQVATRGEIADFVRREAWGHHASCSNRMGPASDPLAVVGSDFRVHGTEGLRVVDASVFPRIPGLFIVTAVYMIAEKATDIVLSA